MNGLSQKNRDIVIVITKTVAGNFVSIRPYNQVFCCDDMKELYPLDFTVSAGESGRVYGEVPGGYGEAYEYGREYEGAFWD